MTTKAEKALENINKGLEAEVEGIASLEEIAATNDVEYKYIKDAWGPGKGIRLQSLTAGDFIEWNEANESEAKRTAGLRLIIKSSVDADGKLMMTDKHLGMLRNKSHRLTENIIWEILTLNGMKLKRPAGEEIKKD